ncbi:hypothetical protein GP486_002867 [Trichoglossum hirsutum]|uniref:Uncharacterized protein n=1 Tax=Trichoglossum hirsutum TaxID=265104 RepID=A0A9P8RRP6_9PEZI|nr:hypothetical protein GP486_002867 [Trichoglossum hirsutum]
MPRTEPHPKTPIRQSTRTSKPSARKRANSESASQPPPSSQRAKKAHTVTSLPTKPQRRQIIVIDDPDEEERADENENEDENEDEDEDEDIASSAIDEDILIEEDIMKYPSVWKAVVNTKETLCSKSGIYTDNLSIYSIRYWQREVIEKAVSRQLEVVRLEAIASYERCRALDECPFELRSQQDVLDALEMLKMWYKQRKRVSLRITLYLKEAITELQSQTDSNAKIASSRRTATQRQLAELPDILQIEATMGNSMPQVADYWTCLNSQCRNKGKTCWVNKPRPETRDNAAEHYPVSGEIFRRWSREIADKLSTVEQPSQQIIVLLVNWRERDRKKSAQTRQTSRPADDISSTTNQLLQTLIATQTQQLAQNLYGGLYNMPANPSTPSLLSLYPLPYTPIAPSSPIHSNSDPSEVLAQFFDWLILKSSDQQRELLEHIKSKLLDEDWNLDTLRDERKGGAMTLAIWESYGFKLGTLANIRSQISEFKQQRRPQSRSSSKSNNSY